MIATPDGRDCKREWPGGIGCRIARRARLESPGTHRPPATTPPRDRPASFGKGDPLMHTSKRLWFLFAAGTVVGGALIWLGPSLAQPPDKTPSSYLPVVEEKFDVVLARMPAGKPKFMKR